MARFARPTRVPTLGVVVALLAGCAGAPSVPSAATPRRITVEPGVVDAALGAAIADVAMGMVGTRYRYGGADPSEGFDCSGLVYFSYAQAGYFVPRTSQELFRSARKISIVAVGRLLLQ